MQTEVKVKELIAARAVWSSPEKYLVNFYFDRIFSDGTKESSVYGIDPHDPDSTEISACLWKQIPADRFEDPPEISEERIEVVKQNVMRRVDDELNRLDSARYRITGQRDPDFEVRRQRSIDEWMDVEKQQGFPREIDWPESLVL